MSSLWACSGVFRISLRGAKFSLAPGWCGQRHGAGSSLNLQVGAEIRNQKKDHRKPQIRTPYAYPPKGIDYPLLALCWCPGLWTVEQYWNDISAIQPNLRPEGKTGFPYAPLQPSKGISGEFDYSRRISKLLLQDSWISTYPHWKFLTTSTVPPPWTVGFGGRERKSLRDCTLVISQLI